MGPGLAKSNIIAAHPNSMVQKGNFVFDDEALALSFIDTQKSRFRALNDWFKSPQGIDIGDAFTAELAPLQQLFHGETLLQLGNCGDNPWLRLLHYSHKWCVTPYMQKSSSSITSLNQLPIDRNSIDCVIAPLVMEAFSHHKNPVDEIDRILKPQGYVIFFGINPLSLWSVFLRLRRFSCFGQLGGKAKSVFFMKRAMLHRGYLQCHLSTFYYIPPVTTEKWLNKLEIFNELGKMISPCPAGFYCLVMQKQQEIHPELLPSTVEDNSWDRSTIWQPACQLKRHNSVFGP
jgi:Methyltransferase domain